jgi:hypothetical protein
MRVWLTGNLTEPPGSLFCRYGLPAERALTPCQSLDDITSHNMPSCGAVTNMALVTTTANGDSDVVNLSSDIKVRVPEHDGRHQHACGLE